MKEWWAGQDRKKERRDNSSAGSDRSVYSSFKSHTTNNIPAPLNFLYPLCLNLLQPTIPSAINHYSSPFMSFFYFYPTL